MVGSIPYPLVFAAVIWSLFGTGAVALIGIKLPGIEFHNQRVEAAYRKELVYGEDDPTRADPPKLSELFSYVRRNYFWLYWNYLYFNIGRIVYLQTDAIVAYFLLGPTIVAGTITLGPMNQIIRAFQQVRKVISSIWSIPGERSSTCCRSTSGCARSRRRSMTEPMPSIETEASPAVATVSQATLTPPPCRRPSPRAAAAAARGRAGCRWRGRRARPGGR